MAKKFTDLLNALNTDICITEREGFRISLITNNSDTTYRFWGNYKIDENDKLIIITNKIAYLIEQKDNVFISIDVGEKIIAYNSKFNKWINYNEPSNFEEKIPIALSPISELSLESLEVSSINSDRDNLKEEDLNTSESAQEDNKSSNSNSDDAMLNPLIGMTDQDLMEKIE